MTRAVTARELWTTDEPPEDMVWDICDHSRQMDEKACKRCPRASVDPEFPEYGPQQQLCYGLAAEVCRIVFAWQKRMTG